VACDVADELQASTFCSVTGYYRVVFSCLRNVTEQTTVALQLELSGGHARFQNWLNGQEELKLGWAADLLPKSARVSALEVILRLNIFDDLFSQKGPGKLSRGFVRRLFGEPSALTHGAPGFTDSDMRKSTSPVFVKEGTSAG
jgi:hypothetical protein